MKLMYWTVSKWKHIQILAHFSNSTRIKELIKRKAHEFMYTILLSIMNSNIHYSVIPFLTNKAISRWLQPKAMMERRTFKYIHTVHWNKYY